MPAVFGVLTTTTDEVPRVVGDPLPLWVWWGAGILLLLVILGAGWYVSRRAGRRS
jgi:hypothetical protein